MRTIDALNILSITQDEISFEIVKKAYRKACKAYHPDINPAGLETMQAVNQAFETLSNEKFPLNIDSTQVHSNYGEALNNALNEVINLQSLSIEVYGAWVWVSGNTKPNKEILKKAKFLWSKNKNMWYFRPENQKKRFFRGSSSIDEIRSKYGSDKIRNRKPYTLSAHV